VYDGQEQTGRKPVRLVIGSQAASQGVVSLAPVLNALLLDVVVQPSGLELKDRVGQSYLRCADHRPWLVCDTDTVPPPPGKRPDALASVDTRQKVTLSAFVDTRASREFAQVMRTPRSTWYATAACNASTSASKWRRRSSRSGKR
jgi:hypothetical protein